MWEIQTTNRFDEWYKTLNDADRENVLAAILVLKGKGPLLSRPYADSVYGSAHSNMKELRIQSKGNPIRAFFAFDPTRIEQASSSAPVKKPAKRNGFMRK